MDDTAIEHAVKHADPNYVCPMHSQIVRGEPGSCPICGMDLVLKQLESFSPAVRLDNNTAHNMGVRTVVVGKETLWKYIESVGRVMYDETRVYHVHPRANGWVERLPVSSEGEVVKRGQTLFEYYSPEIVGAQEEVQIAVRAQGDSTLRGNDSLLASGRERLRLLGLPERIVNGVLKQGKVYREVPMLSPANGVVVAMQARDGMYVTPTMEAFTIADLSHVWVEVNVLEPQIGWVERGKPAEMKINALPGRRFEGEVDYVYPELDPITRTGRVRLKFANADGALKPNMFADVVIYGGPERDVLAIPREALIPSNNDERVVVVTKDGYQPVTVKTGMRAKDKVEVLDGIQAGGGVVWPVPARL